MNAHPAKLLILFPMYEPHGVRQRLSAIDDALVVHRDVEGRFRFAMRDMTKLGPRSYAKWLIRFAADLAAGYVAVVVGRDTFLADIERSEREVSRRLFAGAPKPFEPLPDAHPASGRRRRGR